MVNHKWLATDYQVPVDIYAYLVLRKYKWSYNHIVWEVYITVVWQLEEPADSSPYLNSSTQRSFTCPEVIHHEPGSSIPILLFFSIIHFQLNWGTPLWIFAKQMCQGIAINNKTNWYEFWVPRIQFYIMWGNQKRVAWVCYLTIRIFARFISLALSPLLLFAILTFTSILPYIKQFLEKLF